MCPPKVQNPPPSSAVSDSVSQNVSGSSMQMNVPQQQQLKGKSDLQKLLDFENRNGISVKHKRQKIDEMLKYEKDRNEKIKKQIQKDSSLQGKIKCLKVDCQKKFKRLSIMHRHVAEEHKLVADKAGIYLYECELCEQYSTLQEGILQKHQIGCARIKRNILISKGELNDDGALNTDEELVFQKAQKYN
ncbi:hypothetical protein ABPG72_020530 [Tetrahymena utriculariae]